MGFDGVIAKHSMKLIDAQAIRILKNIEKDKDKEFQDAEFKAQKRYFAPVGLLFIGSFCTLPSFFILVDALMGPQRSDFWDLVIISVIMLVMGAGTLAFGVFWLKRMKNRKIVFNKNLVTYHGFFLTKTFNLNNIKEVKPVSDSLQIISKIKGETPAVVPITFDDIELIAAMLVYYRPNK